MTLSFKAIADEIDIFDADVESINQARKEFWASVREELPARDVKALKAAIKARRKRKADKDGEEAYEARVAEILAEIEAGTDVALAHARRARVEPIPHEITAEAIAGLQARADVVLNQTDDWVQIDPPHDADGVILEDTGERLNTPPVEAAPASGDAVEINAASVAVPRDASPNNSNARTLSAGSEEREPVRPVASSSLPITEPRKGVASEGGAGALSVSPSHPIPELSSPTGDSAAVEAVSSLALPPAATFPEMPKFLERRPAV
jgi:hypothetical protein